MENNIKLRVKSKKNENSYLMFDTEIYIVDAKCNVLKKVGLPYVANSICFYDMYYDCDELKVIVASRGDYDIAFIINEETMDISKKKYTK